MNGEIADSKSEWGGIKSKVKIQKSKIPYLAIVSAALGGRHAEDRRRMTDDRIFSPPIYWGGATGRGVHSFH